MQEVAIKELYNERKDKARKKLDTTDIDNQIDKVLGRITLHKKDEKIVSLFDGDGYQSITKGGRFQSEHGIFTVEDIKDKHHIKVNGHWHHKSEFEPAIVLSFKEQAKGQTR